MGIVGFEEADPCSDSDCEHDQWERIKDSVPGREGHVGGTVQQGLDTGVFVDRGS